MTDTVLVPVKNHPPWSRRVADVVTDVESEGTEAVVLHVFDESEEASTRANLEDAEALTFDELATRKNGVTEAVEVLTDGGVDATPAGAPVADSVSGTILDVGEERGVDRVYLYGRRRNPTGKAVFGSVVQEIILDAGVPVTVVPPARGT